MNYIIAYYNLIQSKKIIVSNKVRLQFEKLVSDINNNL